MDSRSAVNGGNMHPLVDVYLARLQDAAAGLPVEQRVELVEEIREHIGAALPTGVCEGEAEVRNVLDRLGAPEEIAAAAAEGSEETVPETVRMPNQAGEATRRPFTGLEIAALLVLGLGGIIAWFLGVLVGLALVWFSIMWTRREKVVATGLPAALTLILFAAQRIGSLPRDGGAGSLDQQALLLPGTPEMLWGALALGPMLGGALAAVYLGARGRRHRRDYT